MNELKDEIQSLRKRKLVIWGIRQVLSAGLVFYVVSKYPDMKWLVPVWLLIAAASLVALILMLRKLEEKMSNVDTLLEELDESSKK